MAADAPSPWAQWLDAALKKRGWIAADLARTGVVASESTISKWLRSENPPKLVETVINVAHLLGEPDAAGALDAAGMRGAADLIRREIKNAEEDITITRIRGAELLTETDRETMIENYRRRQAETIHYFELQLAEAERRKRAERDGRTRREPPTRAAQ